MTDEASDENVVSLTGVLKMYLRPIGDNEFWDRLDALHEQEAIRNKAEFYSFGWCTGADDITTSKTNRGYLTSALCGSTGKVLHYWKPYQHY